MWGWNLGKPPPSPAFYAIFNATHLLKRGSKPDCLNPSRNGELPLNAPSVFQAYNEVAWDIHIFFPFTKIEVCAVLPREENSRASLRANAADSNSEVHRECVVDNRSFKAKLPVCFQRLCYASVVLVLISKWPAEWKDGYGTKHISITQTHTPAFYQQGVKVKHRVPTEMH